MWSRSFRAPALRRATKYSSSSSSSIRAFATRYSSTPSQGPRNSVGRPDLPPPIAQPIHNVENGYSKPTEPADLPEILRETNPAENTLLSPVHIPEDPNGVLQMNHPSAELLANSGLVIKREMELMNMLLSLEQANRYTIYDAQGNRVGYIIESVGGLGRSVARQWFRTHRSFTAHVFDRDENEVLRIHRPFSWINSCIRIYDPRNPANQTDSTTLNTPELSSSTQLVPIAEEGGLKISQLPLSAMRVIGEVKQKWAPLRRKYDMFLYHPNPTAETDLGVKQIKGPSDDLSQSQQTQLVQSSKPNGGGEYHQFAYVDEPVLSWNFSLRSADDRLVGSVNRNFSGFAREIFTDMGVYALRMDSAALAKDKEQNSTSQPSQRLVTETDQATGMTLNQRALMLATAVSIDFDYFSIHSSLGNAELLPWYWFYGGSSAGGAAEGAGAGTAGSAAGAGASTESTALGEAGVNAVGRAGAAGTITEGATAGAAGAGSMAGYEALQRGVSGDTQRYEDRPSDSTPPEQSSTPEEVWGENQNPWDSKGGDTGPSGGSEGGKSEGVNWNDFDFF